MRQRDLFLKGILSMVLVFGLVLAGCDALNDIFNPDNEENNQGNNQGNNNNSGTSIPSTPTGVSATAQSSSSIRVSWNVVSSATSYDVYYEIGSSTTKNFAGNTTSTSYTHSGLTAGTTYYYYIKAKNSAGESGYSSLSSATTSSSSGGGGGGTTVPNTPTGVIAVAQSSSSIKVGWDPVSNATGYYVYRSSSASGTYNRVGSSNSYTYLDTGLSASTTYFYKVSASNSAGESSLSTNYFSATTSSSSGGGGGGTSVPSAPTGVTATAQSSSSIRITWNSVSSATSYDVYYEIGSSTTKNFAGNTTSTSYTHTGLTANTSYYYYIKAKNSAGDSGYSSYSSAASATTSSYSGGETWPPTVAGTFDGSGTSSNPQVFNGTLSSTSSVLWYKVSWPTTYAEISIMGIDRQTTSSGYTADIVASFYGSSGTLIEGPVNIGAYGSMDRGVTSLQTYYIKVEVNPSNPYTGTFRIGIVRN